MKYNIFTLFDSGYIKFARLFFNSFYKTNNIDNIENIYVYNPTLKEEYKKYLSKFKKIVYINDYDKKSVLKENKWTENIIQKTHVLKQLLEEKNPYPLIMIDIDCMFLSDISDLIDNKFDMQFCCRKWNKQKPLIASFVIINNSNFLDFLELWIKKIDVTEGKIKETPAMCKIYKENKDKFNIGYINYNIVSATTDKEINDTTRIIHCKGSDPKRNSPETRLKKLHKIKKIPNIKKLSEKYIEVTKCIAS